MNNKIINELRYFLPKSNEQKSSFWKYHLNSGPKKEEKTVKNFTPNKIPDELSFTKLDANYGFGGSRKKNIFLSLHHNFFQKLIFNKDIFLSKEYMLFKKLCDLQNRQLDIDVMRHIFTFNFLNRFNLLKKKICIIGDGKANFVGGLLLMKKEDIKIFSINLTEVLIHDYLIIKNSNLIDDDSIVVVKSEKDLNIPDKKLFLIDASNSLILNNNNINLFIAIVSMQEMKNNIIQNYFDIIQNNKAFFYCCNREYKKLYGGEELVFNKYPWRNGNFIVFEDCPWHQKTYTLLPPFIKKYDGNIKHALVEYL